MPEMINRTSSDTASPTIYQETLSSINNNASQRSGEAERMCSDELSLVELTSITLISDRHLGSGPSSVETLAILASFGTIVEEPYLLA